MDQKAIGVGVQILGSEDVFVIHTPRSSASFTAHGIDLFITRLPSYCEMTCSHVSEDARDVPTGPHAGLHI